MTCTRYFHDELHIILRIYLHLLAANEIRLRNSAEEIQLAALLTSRILDNGESKSSPETSGNDEKCSDKQSRDDKEGIRYDN